MVECDQTTNTSRQFNPEDQLRNFLVNALIGAFGVSIAENGNITPEDLYYSEAKAGTTAFHAYATLYARVKNKRYTLAVRRVTHGDTASKVLTEFLGLVDDFDFDVKAVYVDRELYDGKCLTLMQAHNHAYVTPIVEWGTKIQNELSEGWSREIEHDLTTGSLNTHRLSSPSTAVVCGCGAVSVPNFVRY